ncbi:hypothetical protein [Spiroplasma endosymbiont of Tiphia femorata]|uniref:hypothetical protein n=1 Tax=Spiroplasma endosymbiont of Tiphia femorata TaxID=3066326 RepID=UPI0030D2968D
MLKAGSILIFIVFILESIFIIPLLWTIHGFILYKKVSKGEATTDQKIALAILGIIFGAALGIIGGIFILVDLNNDENKIQRY